MVKSDFMKVYEELEALDESFKLKESYFNSFEFVKPLFSWEKDREPEITFDFERDYWDMNDRWNPPYSSSVDVSVTLALSELVDPLLMDYMTDEEIADYEHMFETRQFDEQKITDWINKYFKEASDNYYREHKEDFLESEYDRQREDDY